MAFYGSTRGGPLHEGVEMSTDPGKGWEPRYRATIVPDGTGDVYRDDKKMSLTEAIRWIRDYAEVNGIQDLKEAIDTIEERIENIL